MVREGNKRRIIGKERVNERRGGEMRGREEWRGVKNGRREEERGG